jgi:hypothetical protein
MFPQLILQDEDDDLGDDETFDDETFNDESSEDEPSEEDGENNPDEGWEEDEEEEKPWQVVFPRAAPTPARVLRDLFDIRDLLA